MRIVRAFGRFWYDFLIGDDWKIAVVALSVLVVGGVLVVIGLGTSTLFAPLVALALVGAFVAAVLIDVRAP